MHQAAHDYVARYSTAAPVAVVEFGSMNVNGTCRDLFPNAMWWGIDAQPGPCVDEVADAAEWTTTTPVDVVVCTEVFEHTPNWRDIIATAAMCLKTGGRAVFTCAGPDRPEHGLFKDDPISPGWYRNVTAGELAEAMTDAGFTEVEVETVGYDTRGTGIA